MTDLRLEMSGGSILVGARPVETQLSFFDEQPRGFQYGQIEELRTGSFRAALTARSGRATLRLIDAWDAAGQRLTVTREVTFDGHPGLPAKGVNLTMTLRIGSGSWMFFVPGACYDYCPNESGHGRALISEERASAPLVMAWDRESQDALVLIRLTPATASNPRERSPGETAFTHATELGALGYVRESPAGAALVACLPYAEGPFSRMLGRSLSAFTAFLPPAPGQRIVATYGLVRLRAAAFDEACFLAYREACREYAPRPFNVGEDLGECVRARTACCAGLVREWNGYTGLALNFDPRRSRDAPPSGYGTAFNTLVSSVFPSVLEYGFTGRQLNNAWMLDVLGAELDQRQWCRAAREVARSFVRACARPSGFLHTLYDVNRHTAISPFGDPVGSTLHYGVRDASPGNYIRNMAEAGGDLCLLAERLPDPAVRNAAVRLGQFLLKIQNSDGSWYRAYAEDGRPIEQPAEWFGGSEKAVRSSTSTAVPFLLQLHSLTGDRRYLDAARRAGDWLMAHVVESIDYRGGTLDNPNVVDKEGMAYPMTALVKLAATTSSADYLKGAVRAGGLALTWNYVWDVPFEKGTRLHDCAFRSRGWGGINILWGAGVVDNYSLWFLPGWLDIAGQTGEGVFRDVPMLILHGTQQLLSLPGRMHGLAGVGMQEEGFACSDQGVDEGMIRKGDTWGALGWVFAAGTYGVWEALRKTGNAP